MEPQSNCCECQESIDTENGDYGWSLTRENYLCIPCRDNDESSASRIMVVQFGDTKTYLIGEHSRTTEHGDDLFEVDWSIKREWVRSDPHRGYWNTLIDGWTSIMEGWTTGGWDDPVAQRKQRFNEWAELISSGETLCPIPLAIVSDPTSNLFSMGISVLTPKPNELIKWLGSDFKELESSLL